MNVSTADYINNKINRFPKGFVFTYLDLLGEINAREAVIKYLNRMAASNKIKKLSKGRYFKPEQTPFGSLAPKQEEVLKDLLQKRGQLIGYTTGVAIYNQLGLTTQISNVIEIGRNGFRPPLERGKYKVMFSSQKNAITKKNIPYLQLLDAIRNIKKIPDTTADAACTRLIKIIEVLSDKEQGDLIKLALKYTPATRALLGAMLDLLGQKGKELRSTLNPITKYTLGVSEKVLPTLKNWNIE